MSHPSPELQWIAIQTKTFANWTNEQLTIGNRSVEDLSTDLCDGVNLVALVEALQLKKIGKVYPKPNSRIQKLHNVSLALSAVLEDHVKLVNIGTDDIVGGNLKLTLGLIWHLIQRYQLNASKTKAPPKKLMMSWFQSVLPDVPITNFTTSWNDGVALHALLEFCKPGLSPDWRKLNRSDKEQNCKHALQLAKEQLGVPRVISPEDFASPELDELSAMTYLSYFMRGNSPGYYAMLNWTCKQLKTTNISNLTTDWNDGQYLCALVHSLGGAIPGWPELDKRNHLNTCQLGIDGAKGLGVDPILTAAEMSDPHVDHLAMMAYISKFQRVTPRKSNSEKLQLNCQLSSLTAGDIASFVINPADSDVDPAKVKVRVEGPGNSSPECKLDWSANAKKVASCSFIPNKTGTYLVHVHYDGEVIQGGPLTLSIHGDKNKVKLLSQPSPCKIGKPYDIKVSCPREYENSVSVRVRDPGGSERPLNLEACDGIMDTSFTPTVTGVWRVSLYLDNEQVSEVQVDGFDPTRALLSGPNHAAVGELVSTTVNVKDCGSDALVAEVEYSGGRLLDGVRITKSDDICHVTFTPIVAGFHRLKVDINGEPVNGSPAKVEVADPGQIVVSGDGLTRGIKGVEAYFSVNKQGLEGDITATVEGTNNPGVTVYRDVKGEGLYEFCYIPDQAGVYKVIILWRGVPIAGSPYEAHVTDRSRVALLTKLDELNDDADHIALEYGQPFVLDLDLKNAGPGTCKAEVLSPDGKLPVKVNQTPEHASVSFVPSCEGDHYIHLYWSDVPLDWSPLLAYCPGPPLPIDASCVLIVGQGAETARASVSAQFVIDGRRAGPGVPKVRLQGVHTDVPVEVKALKYDRYRCKYLSQFPGGFLLYISWSDQLLPASPFKVNVTTKGDIKKVKVTGEGLKGGVTGQDLKVFVDTTDAGPGEVSACCETHNLNVVCDVKENHGGQFTIRLRPTEPEKHVLSITYDNVHISGSPFILRVGEPPNPSKVKVFGPGIQNGLIDWFESRFLVDTQGAGAGQLAVKVRGPRGGFKVDMQRESRSERIITCRYDPSEPGKYVIHVRWSGVHVPGSPFTVSILETKEELQQVLGHIPLDDKYEWRAEI